jgi:hypothetical protein
MTKNKKINQITENELNLIIIYDRHSRYSQTWLMKEFQVSRKTLKHIISLQQTTGKPNPKLYEEFSSLEAWQQYVLSFCEG